MRPPWASTIPLQMASPSPDPATPLPEFPPSMRENFRNSRGICSAGRPLTSSETETATWTPSRTALTRMGDPSGEYPAALESRLVSTCTMRLRSAITRGRSGVRSTWRLSRPPPPRNRFLASSTSSATSAGTGHHDQLGIISLHSDWTGAFLI